VLFLGFILPPTGYLHSMFQGTVSTIIGLVIAIIVIYSLYLIFWASGSICDEAYERQYPNKRIDPSSPISRAEKDVATAVLGSLIITLVLGMLASGAIMWIMGVL